jgi:hypothetical protein
MHPDQHDQTGMAGNVPLPTGPAATPPVQPSAIPAISSVDTVQPAAPGLPTQQTYTPSSGVEQRVAEHARHLVRQYGNDPYKLSEALGQLKAKFQAEQFRVVSNQTDNR